MTAPTTNLNALPEPPEIPGYRLIRRLGSGGMADVYLAEQIDLKREVAIKRLRDSNDVALRDRFEREARLIASLEHPNIVPIIEVRRAADGSPCYVMRYLGHGDLAAQPKPMAPERVRSLLRGLLAGLGAAHRRGIVHRDVKPDNVLFDSAGAPLLGDFGIATEVHDDARLTGHGQTVGSAIYMSPEQARGERVDGRSDLYSVGVLAYELLTGAAPFLGNALNVMLRHQQDPIPKLPDTMRAWDSWMQRALAKDPDQRFADAELMTAAIPAFDALGLVTAPARRSSATRYAALAAGVLAVLLVVWMLLPKRTPSIQPVTLPPIVQAPPVIEPGLDALLVSDAWYPPAQPNFTERYLQRRAKPELAALDQGPLATFLVQSRVRLEKTADAELSAQLKPWWDFVRAAKLEAEPEVQRSLQALQQRVDATFTEALLRKDRAGTNWASSFVEQIPGAPPELQAKRKQVAALWDSVEPRAEAGGPLMYFLPPSRAPGYPKGVLLSAPIDAALVGRSACKNSKYVCLSYAAAQRYANELSSRTGARYRLQSLSEARNLRKLPAAKPLLNSNITEWTSTCNVEKLGVVGRGFINLGRTIRGVERVPKTRCVGRFAISQAGASAKAESAALPFRLLRELP